MPLHFPLSQTVETIGEQFYFFKSFIRNSFRSGFEWNEFFRQSYTIGYKSAGLSILTGFILGIVLTLQSQPTLKDFGAEGFIPSMVSISVIREIGPVIIGLICAGKISSTIGAELGSMNVTEQIDAMAVSGANPIQFLVVPRILGCMLMIPLLTILADAMAVSGANPVQFLVVPRILGCMLMIPLLTILADAMALGGGFFATKLGDGMNAQLYFTKAVERLEFSDIFPAIIKTILFGFAIGFTGCWNGFNSKRGTESVGIAANRSVVTASVAIIIIDAFVVQVTNWIVYH